MNTRIIRVIFEHIDWGMVQVSVSTSKETSHLFRYFPDEIKFTEAELIGLTVKEAQELFHKKDIEYLQEIEI